jgi:3-phosphoshikimate 1-carboxyvinyltransferase
MVNDLRRFSALEIRPLARAPRATIRVPGSKSLTNRALLIAALADGTTHLSNALFSDDSRYLAHALQKLGFRVDLDERHASMRVTGRGGHIPASQSDLFIGNSGTAARFLSAFLALGDGEFLLDGDARMRERPMGDLVSALSRLGASLSAARGHLPLQVHASGLDGGPVEIAGDTSSQFLSALLLVAPYARTPVEIQVTTPLTSRPYVEMTLAAMRQFGVEAVRGADQDFRLEGACYQPREDHAIEPDASAASYFFAVPAICGGSVRVEGLSRRSIQGDMAFLDVLAQMGCSIVDQGNCIEVQGGSSLQGIEVDLCDTPDVAQTLAVIAPFASTPTRIRGIATARLKESDRIHATCTELARLGVQVEEHPDGLTIQPCNTLQGARVQTYNDHRMAMAFALIGLRVGGITIQNPGCVSKTFPNFFEVLEALR